MPRRIVTNPHDAFLKVTLSSPQAIHDFFQAYLPEHLREYIAIQNIVSTQPNHISPTLIRNYRMILYLPVRLMVI